MQPDQATSIDFTMLDVYHTFKKGHRIMVQVQSSWFPLVDRNPQQFEDIYPREGGGFSQGNAACLSLAGTCIPRRYRRTASRTVSPGPEKSHRPC